MQAALKKKRLRVGGAALLAALATPFVVKDHRDLGLVFFIGVLSLLALRLVRRIGFSAGRTMKKIDAMDGAAFERYLAGLFRKLGYAVEHTGKPGDLGGDLILSAGERRIAVQAKNYHAGKVGNKAVQQAIAAAACRECDEAMVVTNATFTASAAEQAGRSSIPTTLVGRGELVELVRKAR